MLEFQFLNFAVCLIQICVTDLPLHCIRFKICLMLKMKKAVIYLVGLKHPSL